MITIMIMAVASPPVSPWAGIIVLGLAMIGAGLFLRRKGM